MGRTARRFWCPRGGRGASPPSPSSSPAQPSESCEPASESCCSPESFSSSDSPPLPAALPAALRDSAPALRGLLGAGAARGGGAALAAGAAARPRAAPGASRCGWRPMCSRGGSAPAAAPRAACGAAPRSCACAPAPAPPPSKRAMAGGTPSAASSSLPSMAAPAPSTGAARARGTGAARSSSPLLALGRGRGRRGKGRGGGGVRWAKGRDKRRRAQLTTRGRTAHERHWRCRAEASQGGCSVIIAAPHASSAACAVRRGTGRGGQHGLVVIAIRGGAAHVQTTQDSCCSACCSTCSLGSC